MTNAKLESITVAGDMTIYEADEIKSLFDKTIKSKGDICVNLSNVSEIDSSGLQLMIALKKSADEQSKKVIFESHTEAVIDLLDVFDLANYFGDPIVLDNLK